MRSPSDVVEVLTKHVLTIGKSISPDEDLKIFFAGDFGVVQVSQITEHDSKNLFIRGYPPGSRDEFIVPPERCSFLFRVVPRDKGEKPQERVIIGFAKK